MAAASWRHACAWMGARGRAGGGGVKPDAFGYHCQGGHGRDASAIGATKGGYTHTLILRASTGAGRRSSSSAWQGHMQHAEAVGHCHAMPWASGAQPCARPSPPSTHPAPPHPAPVSFRSGYAYMRIEGRVGRALALVFPTSQVKQI